MELITLSIATASLLAGTALGWTWHRSKWTRRPTFEKVFSPLAANGGSARIATAIERGIGEHGSTRRWIIYSALLSSVIYTALSLRSRFRQSLTLTHDEEPEATLAFPAKPSALRNDSTIYADARESRNGLN